MKLNVILMLSGAAIFIVGLIMTFTGCGSKSNDDKKQTSTDFSQATVDQINSTTEPEPSVTSDSPKDKGNDFEDFIANCLKSNNLTIKEWNKGTVTDEGAFGENALNPDMYVADKDDKINLEYWIECKYRSNIPHNGFELADYQASRYKETQKTSRKKVLIALGLGGKPSHPDYLYLIPLDSIVRFKHIPLHYLEHYKVEDPANRLKTHVRDYFFNDVFKKSY